MTNTAPYHNPSRIEALLPLMRGWLMLMASVLIALVERSKGRHRRLLRPLLMRVERGLRDWIFVSALQRVVLAPWPMGTSRPRSARRGFRYALCRGSMRRRFTQWQCTRGPLTVRLNRIYAIAADLERFIARFTPRLAKMLHKGLLRGRLVSVAPPALAFACNAPAFASASADTS